MRPHDQVDPDRFNPNRTIPRGPLTSIHALGVVTDPPTVRGGGTAPTGLAAIFRNARELYAAAPEGLRKIGEGAQVGEAIVMLLTDPELVKSILAATASKEAQAGAFVRVEATQ